MHHTHTNKHTHSNAYAHHLLNSYKYTYTSHTHIIQTHISIYTTHAQIKQQTDNALQDAYQQTGTTPSHLTHTTYKHNTQQHIHNLIQHRHTHTHIQHPIRHIYKIYPTHIHNSSTHHTQRIDRNNRATCIHAHIHIIQHSLHTTRPQHNTHTQLIRTQHPTQH